MTVGQSKWVKIKLLRKINKNGFWDPKNIEKLDIKFGANQSIFDRWKNTHCLG